MPEEVEEERQRKAIQKKLKMNNTQRQKKLDSEKWI